MVALQHISKSYGKEKILAVDDVTFTVEKGELFGLIGPDGAGKTSIFRMLTTLLLPDGGSATVAGHDIVTEPKKIRAEVGYMPGRFSLYQDLTVAENLHFFATVFNTTVEDNYDLIKEIYDQIAPFKDRRAGQLSGGMKQKLALCCALVHRPKVLFLDEPTTGVDTVSRKEFWEMLKRLKAEGITILVSTPYMDEAALCERIALIQDGKILSIDTPEAITQAYPKPLFSAKANQMSLLLAFLRKHTQIDSCHSFGAVHHFTFVEGVEGSVASLANEMRQAGFEDVVIESIPATIEDCFIQLMEVPDEA